MDFMLSGAGFGMPFLESPLHELEEDQQILLQDQMLQQQEQQQMPPVSSVSLDLQEIPAWQEAMHIYPPGFADASEATTSMTPSSDPGIVPKLQNVISTVNLGCKLDLKKIALYGKNVEYKPKRFGGLIMRIRNPKTTSLIFSSGKMVCTGAKSEKDSRIAARKHARIIQKLGFPAKFLEFKIRNMVASCNVNFLPRLKHILLAHRQYCNYEPEKFPALAYRMKQPKILINIFATGKVILTGAKERKDINEAFKKIYPILKDVQKQ